VPLPRFTPLPLSRWRAPFVDPAWLWELKHDGFRALAYVNGGKVRLMSRNSRTFSSWPNLCAELAKELRADRAVLDGEVVCLAEDGRCDFRALLHRRADPYFYAFDVLWLDGEDLRDRALIDRKRVLRRLMPRRQLGRLRYVDHVIGDGVRLFQLACEHDVEGVVAKPKRSGYRLTRERSPWLKIKNVDYSQARDRFELLEDRRARRAPM
jgi:bifunctional non-homologous end joining protein LigD